MDTLFDIGWTKHSLGKHNRSLFESGSSYKVCTYCHVERERSFFTKNSKSHDGLSWKCTVCASAEWRESYRLWKLAFVGPPKRVTWGENRNKELFKNGLRVCTACCRELDVSAFHKWCNSKQGLRTWCIECTAHDARLRKYGLTPDEYHRLLRSQGGVCAICRTPDKTGSQLHVDHCHDGGQVRALLCYCCNAGLGYFKDSPNILHRAADYLQSHGKVLRRRAL